MNETVLIVEDEERMRNLLYAYFNKENYLVLTAENGVKALELFKNHSVNLVILDIMMPLMDGFTVCTEMRKSSDVPIIILTAKSEEEDKLLGYELGADDYITKPFSPRVLVAKGKALLKRVGSAHSEASDSVSYDGLMINEASHEVSIDGREIYLSPTEFQLLLYFIKNKGIALTRDVILDAVWGVDYYGDLRTVDTHVKRLREKLQNKASLISTVRGSGYKFEVRK
jgi:two-component system, OmpR family, response regulator ResD